VTGFRFSYNVFGLRSAAEFVASCQRGESLGYDTVFAADHLGLPSPFPTLVAAAAATERLRVGTLVLNAPFWNDALLARDIATTDVLTGGRLEIGLGAGHMKWEFEEARIPWQPFGERVDGLRATIDELGRQFAMDGFAQQAGMRAAFGEPALRPVQRHGFGGSGPPLLIGGTGDRVLRLAAETADIVAVAGLYQVPGEPPGTFRLGTAAEIDERVAFARDCAGDRADRVEWHVLVQLVAVTDDRDAAAVDLAQRYGVDVEELLATPFALIGTPAQMADQIRRNRDRYGFTYYTVHAPFTETFAPVIELLR
jgi:probable F420-dependent oxidoreductase